MLGNLLDLMRRMKAIVPEPRDVLYCHPNNREWLLRELAVREFEAKGLGFDVSLTGMEIVFSADFPERSVRTEWQPPDDPFVIYEESEATGRADARGVRPLLPIVAIEVRSTCA